MDLRPITEICLDPAAVQKRLGPPRRHFGKRAQERGISSVPGDVLALAIAEAVRRGRDDLVARLYATHEGTILYRFRVAEGLFYAIVSPHGRPVTCYDQAMFAANRRNLRTCRKSKRRKNAARAALRAGA